MNLKKLLLLSCNLFGLISFAQVGINTTTPDAQLDIRATSATAPTSKDGLLIPKVDVFPATNPTAAQQGMLLYLTTAVGTKQPGFYYWDNPTTSWIGLSKDATAWQLAGNTVNATTDFMGSTNDADVIFKRNNTRAGRIGANNVSLGINALNTATTGSWNAAVGGSALLSNTSGSSNTAVGDDAARGNTTGGFNTVLGSRALRNNTTGNDNIAIGYQALESNNANENVAIGNYALQNTTTGYQNTAIGTNALLSTTTGYENSATGLNALRSNTTGRWLTANGAYALRSNTTGEGSTAVGVTALENNTTGNRNTAIGQAALRNNNIGTNNTATGYQALLSNVGSATTGFYYNDFVNGVTLYENYGNSNTAYGYNTLRLNTRYHNSAFGTRALESNTTGYSNSAFGSDALTRNTTGEWNAAFGVRTLLNNTTGTYNTAVGTGAAMSNSTGNNNVAIGRGTLLENTTGSYNTALGTESFLSGATYSNSTALGYNTQISASNQIRLGNNAVTSIGGQVGWTNLSDARFKNESAKKVPGIDFIKKLRPITYYLNHDAMNAFIDSNHKGSGIKTTNRDASSMSKSDYKPEYAKILESGFMAQEVEQAAKELGYEFNGVDAPKNEKDYYGLRYAQFVVPLVKAVQELNEKLEQKQTENDNLKAMLLELEKRITKLENTK